MTGEQLGAKFEQLLASLVHAQSSVRAFAHRANCSRPADRWSIRLLRLSTDGQQAHHWRGLMSDEMRLKQDGEPTARSDRSESAAPPPFWDPIARIEFERLFGRVNRLDRRFGGSPRCRLLHAQCGRQQLVHGGDSRPAGGARLPFAARTRGLVARKEGASRGSQSGGRGRDSRSLRDHGRRHPDLRPDLAGHRTGGGGADRRHRGGDRGALVLDAGRQRRDARRPRGADARRHRGRRGLDRLRRPSSCRQRRRPPLAALELAGARRPSPSRPSS